MHIFRAAILMLLSGLLSPAIAQNSEGGRSSGLIKGRLVFQRTGQPATDVLVTIPALKQLVNTEADGTFQFSQVPYGTHMIVMGGQTVQADTIKVTVSDKVADVGDITVSLNDSSAVQINTQIPTIALEENNVSTDDEGVRSTNVSGLLSASRDPFLSAAAFVFGPYRFQPRGYGRNTQEVQINGNPMNDVETGDAFWGQWGGLNDVFRSRSNTYGLQPSEYTFGGTSGSVYFDATASGQRKQTRVTYSVTNRSYRNRVMFTKSSGLTKSGWAYSLSASRRWAKEGYIPGTFYDGYSYYAAVCKQVSGGRHEFNLVTFGAPTRRGLSAPVLQETVDISGDRFYNPNWGYQSGEKRNARVASNYQPITVLSYEYRPSNSMRWMTSAGYQFGKSKKSGLDYFNGANPRPDYYRYLPSYFGFNNLDPALAPFNRPEKQQINWDALYNVNAANVETIGNVDGIAGNSVTGRRSVYALFNDVEDVRKLTLNSNMEKVINDHLRLTGGIQFISQKTESYREMEDLLGGDFYLNVNQFVNPQAAISGQAGNPSNSVNQYDLDNPNRLIRKGDRYNYSYINRFTKGSLWAQGMFNFNKVDFFAAARLGYNDFSREGLFRNGIFPEASFGKSDVQRFSTFNFKGGITYKLDGRNFLFVNGLVAQEAPSVDNTFISGRSRNLTVDNPTVEKNASLEAGYLMRTPKYNLRAVGYVTDIKDAAEIKRYYSDFGSSFVNYVMQGIRTRNTGLELAAEVKVNSSLSVTGVAAVSQAFYTDNPSFVGIYNDNDSVRTPVVRDVHIKDYYIAAGPQSAYTLGLNYRSRKYWYASLNLNYFDRNYVDISPDRRTGDAVAGVPQESVQYHTILDQQQIPSAFTVDVFGGKSILLSRTFKSLPKNTFLYINAGISNLFDTELRTGGFEQLRYDFETNNPAVYDTKYFYGLGRNFFVNLSLKF